MPYQEFHVMRSGERLLTYLKKELGEAWSTRQLKWLIEHNRCRLNGFMERFCSIRLKRGDVIAIALEKMEKEQAQERVLYEDEHLLFYNKPPFCTSEQLGKELGYHLVHRLDRDTSGVMVLVKQPQLLEKLEALFASGDVQKRYLAWVTPPPKLSKGRIELALIKKVLHDGASIVVPDARGKEAVTEWKVMKRRGKQALLSVFPKTGRTHQIRAHLKALGSPIVGDMIYGGRLQQHRRPLLHAELLTFELEGKRYQVQAPVPEDFSLDVKQTQQSATVISS